LETGTFLKALFPRPKLVRLLIKPETTVNKLVIPILEGPGRIATNLGQIIAIIILNPLDTIKETCCLKNLPI
jgi:hypothetical protein